MTESIERRICEAASQMRKDVVRLTYNLGGIGAHIGGALSLIEIMATLYLGVMKYDIKDMCSEKRDRLIFSKGHGTLALYTAMKEAGIISKEQLDTYKKNEGVLSAHPSMNKELGIEFSSGSLGQGLSLGVGCCLGLMRKHNEDSRVFVVLGDGECNEGSIWEAAQSAVHFQCANLVAIVDRNRLQYDGETQYVMNDDFLKQRWESCGFKTIVVDGHDVCALYEVLNKKIPGPLAVIAETTKGKGISFMENNPLWHNHTITEKQYKEAMFELGGSI